MSRTALREPDAITCPTCAANTLSIDGEPLMRFCYRCQRRVDPSSAPAEATEGRQGTLRAMTTLETAKILALPYPLSTNNLFTTWPDGSRHKSEAALAYREEASNIARRYFAAPLQGRVSVEIVYRPKRGIGMDVDNCTKCALDSLKGIAWRDDSQVWRLLIERREQVDGGAFLVSVEELV